MFPLPVPRNQGSATVCLSFGPTALTESKSGKHQRKEGRQTAHVPDKIVRNALYTRVIQWFLHVNRATFTGDLWLASQVDI